MTYHRPLFKGGLHVKTVIFHSIVGMHSRALLGNSAYWPSMHELRALKRVVLSPNKTWVEAK